MRKKILDTLNSFAVDILAEVNNPTIKRKQKKFQDIHKKKETSL